MGRQALVKSAFFGSRRGYGERYQVAVRLFLGFDFEFDFLDVVRPRLKVVGKVSVVAAFKVFPMSAEKIKGLMPIAQATICGSSARA